MTMTSTHVAAFTEAHRRNVDNLNRYKSEVAAGKSMLLALTTIDYLNDEDLKALKDAIEYKGESK